MHPITAEEGLARLLFHCRGVGSTAPGSILKGKGEDVGETQVRFQRKGFQVYDSVLKGWPQQVLFVTKRVGPPPQGPGLTPAGQFLLTQEEA